MLALEWWAIGRDEARSKAGVGLFAQRAQDSQSFVETNHRRSYNQIGFFFFFLTAMRGTQDFKFPDRGSNPSPLQWKCSLNPWNTRQVPRLAFHKALVDKQNQGPCADKQLVRKTSQRGGGIHLSARSNVQLGSEEPESPPASEGRRGERIRLQVSQRGKRLTQSLWL